MVGFFSFEARIARPRLLIGIVVGLAIGWIGVLILREVNGIATPLVGGVAGLTIAKLVIESGRRRHDMGKSVGWSSIVLAVAAVGVGASLVIALGTGSFLPLYVALVLFVALWMGLLMRRGDRSPNSHGAVPPALTPTFGRRGAVGGAILAIALTAGGVALGVGANLWLDGMAAQGVQDQAAAARPSADVGAQGADNLEAAYEEQAR